MRSGQAQQDLRVVGNGLLRMGGNYSEIVVNRDALFDGRELERI